MRDGASFTVDRNAALGKRCRAVMTWEIVRGRPAGRHHEGAGGPAGRAGGAAATGHSEDSVQALLGNSERHPQRVHEGRVVQPRPSAVVPQVADRDTSGTLALQQPQGGPGPCVRVVFASVMRHRPPGVGSAIRLSVCPPDRSNPGNKLPDVSPAGLHGSALKKTCHSHSRHWLAATLSFLLYPGSRVGAADTNCRACRSTGRGSRVASSIRVIPAVRPSNRR